MYVVMRTTNIPRAIPTTHNTNTFLLSSVLLGIHAKVIQAILLLTLAY